MVIFWGTAIVVKKHKRLHIETLERGQHLYTPPNFVTLPNREPLAALARRFTQLQRRDIGDVMEFETQWTPRPL